MLRTSLIAEIDWILVKILRENERFTYKKIIDIAKGSSGWLRGLLRALSRARIKEKRENETLEATAATAVNCFAGPLRVPFQPHLFSIAYDSCFSITKKGESKVWFCCMATFS